MDRDGRSNWQLNILLTAGVMATVFLALVLAQLDALQGRGLPQRAGLPIVDIQATAVSAGQVIPLVVDPDEPAPAAEAVSVAPDDLNPRPEFITGVSEEGVIFTVCGEVPEGWLLYTVQPGETLVALAAGTQSTAAELMAANCLADGTLTTGMQLLVPRQPALSLCGPPQWWVRYQARPGDTLGALARNRGTTIDEILRANCRDSLDLLAGQSIFLPPGVSGGGSAPLPQPSLTPLPPTIIPTVAPLPTATEPPAPPTQPPSPVPPSPTIPVVVSPPRPTVTPPAPPTNPPPTDPPPTNPPPTDPPPSATPEPPPPTDPPPSATPEPPTATPPLPPTDPPPTDPPPTDPPPTDPPPTDPPPTDEPITPDPPDEGD